MKSQIKLCLKVAWLTTSVLMLVVGTNDCWLTSEACFPAGERMFLSMFVLSFPTSIVSVLVALFFVGDESTSSSTAYFTLWVIMTCGGYWQWFIVVPSLFERQKLITLDLRQEEMPAKPTVPEVPPVRAPRPKRIRPISAFDSSGRTPLERALGRRS